MKQENTGSHCSNDLLSFGASVSYPPHGIHRLHAHEKCEIYCVFRGSGSYITEGVRYRLEHGRIILMRPGEMHRAVLTDEEPYECLSFHFSPSIVDCIDPNRTLLAPFFDRPLGMNHVYDRSAVASTEIYTLLRKMREQSGNNEENCLHVTSLLFAVLNELNTLFREKRYHAPSHNSMQGILDYVNQNLTQELSPSLLCEKFHFSRAQLDRNFQKTTGSTVRSYITTKRLLLAKAYMDDGMRSTEAASACGFRDYSTFYRAYRRHFDATPAGVSRNRITPSF